MRRPFRCRWINGAVLKQMKAIDDLVKSFDELDTSNSKPDLIS